MPSEQTAFAARHICTALFAALLFAALVWGQVNFDKMRSIALSRYGQATADTVDTWRATIEKMKSMPDQEKLVQANAFFNIRIRWVQDPEAWGQKDYWATPLETMGKRMGDCEDFAIAKYATLVLAGVDISKLRITYVKAQMGGANSSVHAAHMVLAYYPTPTADPIILDNLITELRPASRRPDLQPVYGFNSQGIWVGGAAKPASTDTGAKLSRWRDLLQRAAAEGLG